VVAAADASGVQQVALTVANTMAFTPDTIEVKAGQPVQVTVTNQGDQGHDFTLNSGVDQPVKIAVDGGQTASATFTLAKPGTYTFVCSVFGHEMGGMKGTITAR
jgi:plastocyanin